MIGSRANRIFAFGGTSPSADHAFSVNCRVRAGRVFTRTANSRAGSTLECRDAMAARQLAELRLYKIQHALGGAGSLPRRALPRGTVQHGAFDGRRSFPPVPARPARLGKTPSRPLGPRCTTVYASGYREPQCIARGRTDRERGPKSISKKAFKTRGAFSRPTYSMIIGNSRRRCTPRTWPGVRLSSRDVPHGSAEP
jgi:hypothetical protein